MISMNIGIVLLLLLVGICIGIIIYVLSIKRNLLPPYEKRGIILIGDNVYKLTKIDFKSITKEY